MIWCVQKKILSWMDLLTWEIVTRVITRPLFSSAVASLNGSWVEMSCPSRETHKTNETRKETFWLSIEKSSHHKFIWMWRCSSSSKKRNKKVHSPLINWVQTTTTRMLLLLMMRGFGRFLLFILFFCLTLVYFSFSTTSLFVCYSTD